MFKRLDVKDYVYADLDYENDHPEKQNVNTRVSEYLLKYGQGKIDSLPTDSRPEINDNRSVDEMLDDPNMDLGLGVDELDVLTALQENAQKFNDAKLEVESSTKDREKFENAVKVLNDPNSSQDAKYDAYRILNEFEKRGKLSYS